MAQTICDGVVGTQCQVRTDKDWAGAWSEYPSIYIAAESPPPGQTPTLTFHSSANVEASDAIQLGNQLNFDATLVVTGDSTIVRTGRMGVGALNNAMGTLIVEDNGLVQVNGIFN